MTEALKVKVRGGFSLLDMKHFVETRGLKGTGFRCMSCPLFRAVDLAEKAAAAACDIERCMHVPIPSGSSAGVSADEAASPDGVPQS
jgi:hypothetical protein